MKKLFVLFVVVTAVMFFGSANAEPHSIDKCFRTTKKTVDVVDVAKSVIPVKADSSVKPDHDKTKGLLFVANKTVVKEGECITLSGIVKKSNGYLYVFNIDSQGQAYCLYPNKFIPHGIETELKDGDKVVIPAPNADFHLQVKAPFGTEKIYAVLTKEKIDPAMIDAKSFVLSSATKVDKSIIPRIIKVGVDCTYIEIKTMPQADSKKNRFDR
jgi:hypothetical protein